MSENNETLPAPSQKFGGMQDILDVKMPEHRTVFVPNWGFNVRLKYLSSVELDKLQASLTTDAGDAVDKAKVRNVRARYAAQALIDEHGSRMFVKPEQIELLGRKDAASLQLLFDEVCEMNGIRERDRKKVIEDLKSASVEAEEV